MRKNKVLVIGDSFSLLDDTHSHWAKLWSNKYGLDTVHYGIPGGNHVNIVSNFFSNNIEYQEVCAVFYFVTDLLRTDRISVANNTSDKDFEKMLVDLLYDLSFSNNDTSFWEQVFEQNSEKPSSITGLSSTVNSVITNYSLRTDIDFYRVTNLNWIIKANYNSMQFLLKHFDSLNIPQCVVNTHWQQGNNLHTKYSKAFQWDCTIPENLQNQSLSPEKNKSENHIRYEDAIKMSLWFEIYRKNNKIFEFIK